MKTIKVFLITLIYITVQGCTSTPTNEFCQRLNCHTLSSPDDEEIVVKCDEVTVSDGDTIHFCATEATPEACGDTRFRLQQVETPETRNWPRKSLACPEEADLGDKAAKRLEELVKGKAVLLRMHKKKSKRDGAHGRLAGQLEIEGTGQNAGDLLAEEKLAFKCELPCKGDDHNKLRKKYFCP